MTINEGLSVIRELYPHWKPNSKYNPNGQILRFATRILEKKNKKELPEELYFKQLNLFEMAGIEPKPSRAYKEATILDDYYLYFKGENSYEF